MTAQVVCQRCGRALKYSSPSGMGPKCATAVLGTKPRRVRLFDRGLRKPDARQPELFGEVLP